MDERACILTACNEPGAEEVGGHLLCVDHTNEARQIMIKTVFGIGPNEMFARRGGASTVTERTES